jgi:hypothetical protein
MKTTAQVGGKVTRTIRNVACELTIAEVVEVSPAMKANKPGLLCCIVAEGQRKRTALACFGEVYADQIVWM